MPETLLTEKSEFSKAARRNDWQEASGRIIKIPEVDFGAFKAHVHWIYKEEVAVSSQHAIGSGPYTTAEVQPILYELVQLWLLADRLADIQLRHLATNAILRVTGRIAVHNQDWTEAITPEITVLLWSRTTSGRAVRHLFVDLYTQCVKAECLERVKDELHPEFIKDLMMKVFRMKDEKAQMNIFRRSVCDYHEHDNHEDPRCELFASTELRDKF